MFPRTALFSFLVPESTGNPIVQRVMTYVGVPLEVLVDEPERCYDCDGGEAATNYPPNLDRLIEVDFRRLDDMLNAHDELEIESI